MQPCKALTTALLLSLFVAGCSTTGDGLSDAALSGDPDAMATDGLRMNTEGSSLVQRGEKRLADGRKQVRDGEEMIQEGSDLVSKTRAEYRNAANAGGTASTPKAVEEEAQRLKKIGSRWEDAIDTIRDGNKLVDKGNKNIDRGQSEIREGRMLMERGSTLVRNSERARLGEELLPLPVESSR